MAEVRETVVSAGGVAGPALESGPADGAEAVVYVHGNPGSSEDWRGLVAATGELARSLAPTLPGFGRAEKPGNFDHSPEGYADWLLAALDGLGIERAHFVVHDVGGFFTWAAVASRPGIAASFTVFNTGLLNGRWHKTAELWRKRVVGELMMLVVPRGPFGRALDPTGTVPSEDIDRIYREFDRGTRRTVLRLYRACNQPYPASKRWVETLSSLSAPATLVWGMRDPFVPPRAITRLQAAFPRAEVVELAESAHFPFLDDPERSREAVLAFLAGPAGLG